MPRAGIYFQHVYVILSWNDYFSNREKEINPNTSLAERIKIMERMLTRKQAAKELGISIYTLDAARNSGQISYVQYTHNGSVFFTVENLQEYIARCTHTVRSASLHARSSPMRRRVK